MLNAMATRYAPENMTLDPFSVGFDFTDTSEQFTLHIDKSMALVSPGLSEEAAATVTLSRKAFNQLITQEASFQELAGRGEVSVSGRAAMAGAFLLALETPEFWFPVATP